MQHGSVQGKTLLNWVAAIEAHRVASIAAGNPVMTLDEQTLWNAAVAKAGELAPLLTSHGDYSIDITIVAETKDRQVAITVRKY